MSCRAANYVSEINNHLKASDELTRVLPMVVFSGDRK